MTALRAIRLKCLGCCYGSSNEVSLCPCQDCPLHSFRLGHNPNYQKKEMSEAKRAALEKAQIARKALKNFNENEREEDPEGKYSSGEEESENDEE